MIYHHPAIIQLAQPKFDSTLLQPCFPQVAFTEEERLVGEAARNQAAQNP